MRTWVVMGLLVTVIVISFLFYGDYFTSMFDQKNAVSFFEEYGKWAWMIAIGLLIADLFLPLPGTIIMSSLGLIYGPWIGGLLAVAGNFLSGMVAYYLCKSIGDKGARWILGSKDYQKGHELFDQKGGWIVALSRWLPILPEAVACMAGLNRMRTDKFVFALFCGSLPLGFIFAYIGHYGIEDPMVAVLASAILPAIFWLIAQYWLRRAVDG